MLVFRTGTEEQQSRRGDLLLEIITIIEREEAPVNEEIGADDERESVTNNVEIRRRNDRLDAEQEREAVLREACEY